MHIPDKFKKERYEYCMNYPLIKIELKELQQFESNQFASSFTQEVSRYGENNDSIFDDYFATNEINENVG